jgi:hypothetical protein
VADLIAQQLFDGGRGDLHSKALLKGGSNLGVSHWSIRRCQDFQDCPANSAEL